MVKIYFMEPEYICSIIYYLYIEPLIILSNIRIAKAMVILQNKTNR